VPCYLPLEFAGGGMVRELTDERPVPAGRGTNRLALAVVIVSVAIFLALAPFAKARLPPVSAFIPIYESDGVPTSR
jgi:4-hydroxybenzoate polyprenyltransferase